MPRQQRKPVVICIIEYIIHFVTLCDTLRRGPCGTTQSSENQPFAPFARQKRDSPHQKRPCSRGLAGIWRADATGSGAVRNYARFTRKSPASRPRCVAGPLHSRRFGDRRSVACIVPSKSRAEQQKRSHNRHNSGENRVVVLLYNCFHNTEYNC